jgi:hypothetical protein
METKSLKALTLVGIMLGGRNIALSASTAAKENALNETTYYGEFIIIASIIAVGLLIYKLVDYLDKPKKTTRRFVNHSFHKHNHHRHVKHIVKKVAQ